MDFFLNNLEIAIENYENEVLDIGENKFYKTIARYGVRSFSLSCPATYLVGKSMIHGKFWVLENPSKSVAYHLVKKRNNRKVNELQLLEISQCTFVLKNQKEGSD